MIDSIEITNWKTHKKTRMEFQKGVNVLIGVMGAGKSSAMDAISFGLFGTFPALLSKRISLAELITNRPSQETEAEVKVKFSVNGDEYTVTRKIGNNGNSAKLEKNGEYLQAQPTKVTEEIESILKIDYDTFSRVVYSEQNQLDYFLSLAKGARKKEIDHMLGLDTFALAEENTTSLINKIKDAVKAEEDVLTRTDEKEIRKELAKFTDDMEKMQKEQEKLAKDEQKTKMEVEKTRKELDLVKKKLEKRKMVSDEIVKLQGRSSTLASEIKKIESMKIDERELASKKSELEKEEINLKKGLEGKKKTTTDLTKTIAGLEAKIRETKKKIADRDKILAEVKGEDLQKTKKRAEEENKLLKELNDIIASKKGRMAEVNEWLKELNKHLSKCPVCERSLEDGLKEKLIESKTALVKSLESEIKESQKSSEEKSKLLEKLSALQNKLALAESRLSEYKDLEKLLEADTEKRDNGVKEYDKEAELSEKLAKEYDSIKDLLNKVKTDLQTAERKKEYESEVRKAADSIEEKKAEMQRIDVDDKSMYSMQDTLTKQSSELSEISSKLSGNQKLIINVGAQMKDKEKQVKGIEEISKRIAKRQKQVHNLNKFKTALVETEAMLRNRLVSSINNLMQGMWPQLYPYGDYLSIRLNAKKDDYLLEVDAGRAGTSEWIQVDGIASGGERSVASLTMRIALAMVIVPNLKWLILDEPTHNIDSAGISKLITILGESLPNVVDQIFIITHEDALKQIASAKVYTLERDKGINAPTSIAEE